MITVSNKTKKSNFLGGVGHNLRLEHIDSFMAQKPSDIPFIEVIGDNWFSEGPHHNKLEKIREDYDVFFHFVGMNIGGTDEIDLHYLKQVKSIVDKFCPRLISDHLALQKSDHIYFHDLLPFAYTEKNLDNSTIKLEKTLNFLKPKADFILENLSYYVEFKESELTELEFLNRLSKNTSTFQLFDINNLLVNHLNLDHDVSAHIESIEWDLIKEIHVAGPQFLDGVYIDTHGCFPSESCLALLKSLEDKIANIPVIYERDQNITNYDTLRLETVSISRHLGYVI